MLILEEPRHGLLGTVVAEGAGGCTPADYHRFAVMNTYGADSPVVEEPARLVSLGAGEGMISKGSVSAGAHLFELHVLTTVAKGRAVQVIIYGLAGNMRSAKKEVEAALLGLRLVDSMVPVEKSDGRLTDVRMGFSVAPPGKGWRYSDLTPPAIRPLGSLHSWSRRRDEFLALGVFGALDTQNSKWFENYVTQMIRQRIRGVSVGAPQRSKVEVGGREVTKLVFEHRGKPLIAVVLTRGRTFFALLLGGPVAEDAAALQSALDGFRLLD